MITLNFVYICERLIASCGCQPGVVPSEIGTVVHDPLQGEAEGHFVGRDPRGSVQVRQDGVVVDDDHNLKIK
jgi:hypothetical protein